MKKIEEMTDTNLESKIDGTDGNNVDTTVALLGNGDRISTFIYGMGTVIGEGFKELYLGEETVWYWVELDIGERQKLPQQWIQK